MTDKNTEFDRRLFMAGAVGAAATLGALGAARTRSRLPAVRRARPPPVGRRPVAECCSGRRGSIGSRPTFTIAR